MVDIVVAVSVFCSKMLVNHSAIIQRGNILVAAFALLVYVWHILTNANDLACSDRRVRPAGVPFVLFEVIQKDLQNIVKRVNTPRIHARCYLSEFLEVKDHTITPYTPLYARKEIFSFQCGGKRKFPFYSLTLVLFLLLFLFLLLCHAVPCGTVWFRTVIPSEVCLLLTRS